MEKIGVLVVSYGARAVAMVDAFKRSINYDVKIFVADKQRNPFNVSKAERHTVIPDLNIDDICRFGQEHKDRIDFGIVGPERPIIDGVRNLVEERTGIPMICPTKEYAIEASKVAQRLLFERVAPEANPAFKVFDPKEYKNDGQVRKAVYSWLDELGDRAVVKPDRPATGKGVGVSGDHFTNREQLFQHFLANLQHGSVIIEEKIEGEESSFQAFCDGKHLVPLPETRDYKRAFVNDEGPNTGGMGAYKDVGDLLPFMRETDRAREIEIVSRIFENWRAVDSEALRGMPFYTAFMHTGKGPKILENNSRPGDPEIINILPIIKDDFVDVCFKILEGNLTRIELEKSASVAIYKVPPSYGGYMETRPDLVRIRETERPIDLASTYDVAKKYGDSIRFYPASIELRNGGLYALKSRAISVVGVSESIETARQIAVEGIETVKGGALWFRKDIGSREHIGKSMKHLEELRRLQQ